MRMILRNWAPLYHAAAFTMAVVLLAAAALFKHVLALIIGIVAIGLFLHHRRR